MTRQTIEKCKMAAMILAGILMIVSAIGVPSREALKTKRIQRSDSRLLENLLKICIPLPDKAPFGIPGYKSLQCFYKENKDGTRSLVEDLNMPVSIPKPVPQGD